VEDGSADVIVQAHGDTIAVKSEVGRGTTFTVTLALIRARLTGGERHAAHLAHAPAGT
jgi:K+-sensing histidine kinase KdpD